MADVSKVTENEVGQVMTRRRTRQASVGRAKAAQIPPTGEIERAPSLEDHGHKHVPELRPFIKHFYRVNYQFQDALFSIFELHNETLNVYTHLVPFLFLVWRASRVLLDGEWPEDSETERWLLLAYIGAAMVTTLCSSVYHLFACVSTEWARTLLAVDMSGIALLIGMSFVCGLYAGFRCAPATYLVYSTLCIGSLATVAALVALPTFRGPWWDMVKQLCMAGVVVYGAIPALHWATSAHPILWEESLGPTMVMLLGYGIGFLVFILRIPERWIPGMATSIASSHAFWHLAVAVAAWAWLEGIEHIFRHVFPHAMCASHDGTLTVKDAVTLAMHWGNTSAVNVSSNFTAPGWVHNHHNGSQLLAVGPYLYLNASVLPTLPAKRGLNVTFWAGAYVVAAIRFLLQAAGVVDTSSFLGETPFAP